MVNEPPTIHPYMRASGAQFDSLLQKPTRNPAINGTSLAKKQFSFRIKKREIGIKKAMNYPYLMPNKKNPNEEDDTSDEIQVYGGKVILPALDLADMKLATSADAERFVRRGMHDDEKMFGWPNANDFDKTGFIIQVLDGTTARVVLVMDHPEALHLVSMYAATYQHIGFELIIDSATYVAKRNKSEEDEREEEKAEDKPTVSLDSFGMEVA